MKKSISVTSAAEKLNELLPDALQVIRETIRAEYSLIDEDGKDKAWPAPALNTSIWLVEKLTGKAKTEDAQADSGLMKQMLQLFQDRKTAPAADLVAKQDVFTKQEPDKVNSFVDKY